MQEKATVFSFLKEHNILTINDFAWLLNATGEKVREMESAKKAKAQRIRDIDAILGAVKTLKELNPIQEKYSNFFFTRPKKKFAEEHADELSKIKKARGLLYKLNVTLPINGKALRAESAQLQAEVEAMLPELESMKAELDKQKTIRAHIRKVLPEALTFKNQDGQKYFEDVSSEVQNRKELEALLDRSAERLLYHLDEMDRNDPVQIQQQAQQNKEQKKKQQGAR